MTQTDIILTVAIGLIVWPAILYSIISGASRSKKIERHLRIQNELLTHIANKQGVGQEELKTIFERNKI